MLMTGTEIHIFRKYSSEANTS